MYLPALWTNEDGSINEELKSKILKNHAKYEKSLTRSRRRSKFLTDVYKPLKYVETLVYKNQMKDFPSALYNDS